MDALVVGTAITDVGRFPEAKQKGIQESGRFLSMFKFGLTSL